MIARVVTYHIYHIDGTPWPDVRPAFDLVGGSYTADGEVPPARLLGSATDSMGAGSVLLWCNGSGAHPSKYRCTLPNQSCFDFIVPAGSSPVVLSALHVDTDAPDGWHVTVQALIDTAVASLQAQISSIGGGILPLYAENKDTVTFAPGQPVAAMTSGSGIVRAQATDLGLRALGLVGASTAPSIAGPIRTTGELTLDNWSAVIGTTLLVPRTRYYLSTLAGILSPNAPSLPGSYIQLIGIAFTPHTLILEIEDPILL